MKMRWLLLSALGAVLARGNVALAHSRTSTFSTVAFAETEVRWAVRVAAADLLAPLGLPEALPPEAAAKALGPRLDDASAYVGGRLQVQRGERGCARSPASAHEVASATPPSFTFTFVFRCPASQGPHRLLYELFFELDALHSGFVQLSRDGVSVGADVFRQHSRELTVVLARSAAEETLHFWRLGLEHIFTGYDHLAFLAGLLLLAALTRQAQVWVAARPREALSSTVKIVTAFTVAHSLTLGLAALRPHLVPTSWVEPVIALSVSLVGAENLLPRMPRRRWLLAFGFGLVHGFGFASVLAEVGLPEEGMLRALLAFNVGVECGQLMVVALVLPMLVWIARQRLALYRAVFVTAGSSALFVAGLVWLFARL